MQPRRPNSDNRSNLNVQNENRTSSMVTSIPKSIVASTTPQLLQRALNKTRQFIFNKFPIRLLCFNSDGTGIRLIERGEAWSKISMAMELDFDEIQMESDIRRKELNYSKRPKFLGNATDAVIAEFCSNYQKYAILSHTWIQGSPGEVTYGDWKTNSFDKHSIGYQKLENFCRVAATEYDLYVGLMDTVCINKTSSSELDESIRSMYNWYKSAAVCITFLAGTTSIEQMQHDLWFTRGWTLQELIAPQHMSFYSKAWTKLVPGVDDDRIQVEIGRQIYEATTITQSEIARVQKTGFKDFRVSRRMQWAANRQVTREEDTAYSLIGIFGVAMSPAYGEGAEHAFIRLVKEILNTKANSLLDVINHGVGTCPTPTFSTMRTSLLLASSPRQFLWCAESANLWVGWFAQSPVTVSSMGLHVRAIIMPGRPIHTGCRHLAPVLHLKLEENIGLQLPSI
ncbi:hypothetical protein HYPSUDRAFT_1005122 [Hypholoma sublateritium FD-334 SS-4]|uniref:Heterokaryon incompatibility domain-containing protein n=1 Tax=Hypholoma sublateritium (strain FD-334 SS-4) TaxID=945553 RepID=A0A0D2M3I4_HYPSF|nr:hypothetical protein HYPSUDRAFT_1005122 [Hypholoma sublateritium FD-334 SS-4]